MFIILIYFLKNIVHKPKTPHFTLKKGEKNCFNVKFKTV